jgi:hypothetical protein
MVNRPSTKVRTNERSYQSQSDALGEGFPSGKGRGPSEASPGRSVGFRHQERSRYLKLQLSKNKESSSCCLIVLSIMPYNILWVPSYWKVFGFPTNTGYVENIASLQLSFTRILQSHCACNTWHERGRAIFTNPSFDIRGYSKYIFFSYIFHSMSIKPAQWGHVRIGRKRRRSLK